MVHDKQSKAASKKPVVVLGVIGNDIHVVGNRVLEICLNESGIQTINLGTNTKPQEFVDVALECSADVVLIGSLNGEAQHWCYNIRTLFINREIGNTLIYLGGNLLTGSATSEDVFDVFKDFRIDRLFHGETDFDNIIKLIKKDILKNELSEYRCA